MPLEFKVALVFIAGGLMFTTFLYGVYKFYRFLMSLQSYRNDKYIDSIELKRQDRNISYERPEPNDEPFDSRKHCSVQNRR